MTMRLPENFHELAPSDLISPLGPGSPREAFRPRLAALTPESLFPGQKIVDESAASCCLSALLSLVRDHAGSFIKLRARHVDEPGPYFQWDR